MDVENLHTTSSAMDRKRASQIVDIKAGAVTAVRMVESFQFHAPQ